MAFQKLQFNLLPKTKMLNHSKSFLTNISSRRSVRDFSDKAVPIELITNAIKAAASAPSGALAAALTALVIISVGTASSEKSLTDLLELILARKDFE